jgi:hypothetical protein
MDFEKQTTEALRFFYQREQKSSEAGKIQSFICRRMGLAFSAGPVWRNGRRTGLKILGL